MTRLLIIYLTLTLISCGQKNSHNENNLTQTKTKRILIDTSLIAILPYDSTYSVFKKAKPAVLTEMDFQLIETILTQCFKEYNTEMLKQFNEICDKYPNKEYDKKSFIIDLKRYKRQYITVTNSKGEKEVWINCFCDTWGRNWKVEQIEVKDGGNCYFDLKINLENKKYYDLMINGDA